MKSGDEVRDKVRQNPKIQDGRSGHEAFSRRPLRSSLGIFKVTGDGRSDLSDGASCGRISTMAKGQPY